MDFAWTEEQAAFRESVVRFAQKELNGDVAGRDQKGEFFWEGWRKCAEFGIHGLPIPAQYGGSGADVVTTMLAMEALGYGCRDNGLLFSINAHMWSCQAPILTFGTEAQRNRYLPGLVSGKLVGVHAVTEPESGSDAFSMKTRAERTSEGYRLTGTKIFISNGPIADIVVVFATVNPKRKMAGVSAFLVERGTPGLQLGQEFDKMGLRTSRMGELVFDNCVVGEDQRLGQEGAGAAIFNHSMAWERSCLLGTYIGMMERQLEECVEYARRRKQFGRPIGNFQLIAGKIADMKVRLETARLLLYRMAWSRQTGKQDMAGAAMAKLYISECLVQSSLDAVQIHGAYGYMKEAGIERELRDAIAAPIYSGTSEIQRLIIASSFGLGPFT